ncbi:peptidoglycan DD-metalloendopeptidase family protein [Peribacillus sp. SCS-155]|uniref:peptidoglycan DD-metalloendopeptidase family protein n=1 Tax=Peribacillus sedimenti TaxID=3115297 RepID=UPI0039067E30
MKDRRKEIQDRIAKRRKMAARKSDVGWTQLHTDDHFGHESNTFEGHYSEKDHPLFKKEYFYFKLLGALCLFLIVAVMFRHPSAKLDRPRDFVAETMDKEIQFAAISDWYEDKFGKPIAFLPAEPKTGTEVSGKTNNYSVPVTGKIAESFDDNGEGIILETGPDASVDATKEGIVIFAGNKEDLGKTVVIQHGDKSESWYGQLQTIDVKLYQRVSKGKAIGQVKATEDGSKGTFYLAIKKENKFIDPKKVIPFD